MYTDALCQKLSLSDSTLQPYSISIIIINMICALGLYKSQRRRISPPNLPTGNLTGVKDPITG